MASLEQKEETLLHFGVPIGYREEGRLDVYLTRCIPLASRAKVQQGIREGQVRVNGVVVKKVSHVVRAGDVLECQVWRAPTVEVVPEPIPLDIVYEDEWVIVVNKPAGMVVHPAYGNRTGTLVHALLYHVGGGPIRLEEEDETEDADDETSEAVGLSMAGAMPTHPGDLTIRPGIVHRLDKDTSGLLVVAKDDVTHRFLAKQFEDRTIWRAYQAIVWGVPDPAHGVIDAPIGRDPRDRKRMAVVKAKQGKQAVTRYETLEAFQYSALLRFRLETGRTHQIRVHARHIGHPVLGDLTYGGQEIRYGPQTGSRKAFFKNLFEKMPRQALHAHTLGFIHPQTKEPVEFSVEMPEDMAFVLARLRAIEGKTMEEGF